jgi:hypothetical protein
LFQQKRERLPMLLDRREKARHKNVCPCPKSF